MNEACFDWTQKWGFALAYGLTQSMELSEQAVAEAMAAMLTGTVRQGPYEPAIRYASLIYDLGTKKAYRGFSQDDFFKLNAVARSAVILKVRGRFSLPQISKVLGISAGEVERLLEGARLGHSKGRAWLASSPGRRQLDDAREIAPCPDWMQGKLFAQYLENDLKVDEVHCLHQHFVSCTHCRVNLIHFKNNYSDWLLTVPDPEMPQTTIRYLRRTARMALRARPPLDTMPGVSSPLPGLRRLLRDQQFQIAAGAILVFILLKRFF